MTDLTFTDRQIIAQANRLATRTVRHRPMRNRDDDGRPMSSDVWATFNAQVMQATASRRRIDRRVEGVNWEVRIYGNGIDIGLRDQLELDEPIDDSRKILAVEPLLAPESGHQVGVVVGVT